MASCRNPDSPPPQQSKPIVKKAGNVFDWRSLQQSFPAKPLERGTAFVWSRLTAGCITVRNRGVSTLETKLRAMPHSALTANALQGWGPTTEGSRTRYFFTNIFWKRSDCSRYPSRSPNPALPVHAVDLITAQTCLIP